MSERRMTKFVRIYKSDRGIWRCEIERDGVLCWYSLRTKDDAEARRKAERQKALYERAPPR